MENLAVRIFLNRRIEQLGLFSVCLIFLLFSITSHAEPLRLAVAANFKTTLEQLVQHYQASTGAPSTKQITMSVASSGVLANQIKRGAPFHLFFSADAEKVDWLIQQNIGMHARVYALGQLVLWAPKASSTSDLASYLASFKDGNHKLALANAAFAPYGKAAEASLAANQLLRPLQKRLVTANNVAQVAQFVASGAASAGFISASQLPQDAIFFTIDPAHYPPIAQKVLLVDEVQNSKQQNDAKAFYCYLTTQEAMHIIQKNGYALPSGLDDKTNVDEAFCKAYRVSKPNGNEVR